MFFSQFPLTFPQSKRRALLFIALLFIILVLIGMVFMIIQEISHGRISLKLLLLPNCVSGFRLEIIYISLIVSIWSNFVYLHVFWVFLLLPVLIEITSFVCINRINLFCLRPSLDRLCYANKAKECITFLKLDSRNFWQIVNSVLKKHKPAKWSLGAVFCIWNSNLDDSGICLPASPSKINIKLNDYTITIDY